MQVELSLYPERRQAPRKLKRTGLFMITSVLAPVAVIPVLILSVKFATSKGEPVMASTPKPLVEATVRPVEPPVTAPNVVVNPRPADLPSEPVPTGLPAEKNRPEAASQNPPPASSPDQGGSGPGFASIAASPASVEPKHDGVEDQRSPPALRDDNPPPPPAPPLSREAELRKLFTDRGFTLVVHTFLLEHVEAEALARLKKMHLIIDRLERLHQLWFENEQIKELVNQIDNQIIEKNGEIQQLVLQLNNPMPGLPKQQQAVRAEINQRIKHLRGELIELRTEFDIARKRVATPKQLQEHDQEFRETRQSFREAFDDMRPACDRVVAEYNKHKQDDQLIDAIKELKTIKKAKVAIGPSEAFTAGIARIKKTEKILPPRPRYAR